MIGFDYSYFFSGFLGARSQIFQPPDEESSLLDLKRCVYAVRTFKTFPRFAHFFNVFRSAEAFFYCLNRVHEDTLRAFSIRQLNDCEYLPTFLRSGYAQLSDENFLKVNAFSADCETEECISIRLSHIQQYKRDLVFPEGFSSTKNYSRIGIKSIITLRDIRGLDTQERIERVFLRKLELIPTLLSPEQKLLIRNKHLFDTLLLFDNCESMRQYLPKMDPQFINERLLKSKHGFFRIPFEVIPLLDLSLFSDSDVRRFVSNNLEHFDKIYMSNEKLYILLKRLITMATTSDKVHQRLVTGQETDVIETRNQARFNPHNFERIPDVVFQKINFEELSKRELFCLFYPKSFENDEKFGSVILEDGDRFKEIVYQDNEDHITRRNIPLPFWYSKTDYIRRVKDKEEYNRHRLTLIGKEVYEKIRGNLDQEIVILGDSIFYSHFNY